MYTPHHRHADDGTENTSSDDTIAGRPGDEHPLTDVVAAHGSESFLSQKSLTLSGTGSFFTPPQIGCLKVQLDSFTFHTASGGRSRLEAKSAFGKIVFLIRGAGKGGLAVIGGRTLQLPDNHVNGVEPLDYLRTAFTDRYAVGAIAGGPDDTTQIAGEERGYMVRSVRGISTRLFIDPQTKRIRRLVTENSRGEMTVLLSDYRSVDGIPVACEIRLLENGAEVFHLCGNEVAINTTLNDRLFEMP